MPAFFRRDDWVTDAMGNALSGANVWVTSQPSNPAHFIKGKFVPPSPLVQIYGDAFGMTPLTQPVQTDGYGHAFYYVASGTYTITYFSPQIGIVTLPDQFIGGQALPVNSAAPLGVIDDSNRVFTLAGTPTNYLLLYLNGVFQEPGADYTISGPTITMTNAPEVGDRLWSVYQ
jgi:hypothetical protein